MNITFKLFGALIVGTLVLGCGLTESGPVVSRVDGIDIAPGRLSLQPFQTADLRVVALTSRGDTATASSLVWSTTGGLITNTYTLAGVRYLTYTAPQLPGGYHVIVTTPSGSPADSNSITVTTTALPVNAVTITPSSISLVRGDTTRLLATLTEAGGSVVVGRAITWVSSDAGIATVLSTGSVRAVTVGTVTITATSEGHSGTATVTVTP